MKTIVFIIGSGHSGSTVLDMALGSSPNSFSLGEIVSLGVEIKNNTPCVCGKPIRQCPFWLGVNDVIRKKSKIDFMQFPESFPLMLQQYPVDNMVLRKLRNLAMVLGISQSSKAHRNSYLENTKILYDAVFEVSNKDILIDSSKNLRRALMLNAYIKKYRMLYIHLIRDCRGVAHSYKKDTYSVRFPGTKKKITLPSKSVLANESVPSWIRLNLMATLTLSTLAHCNQWKIVKYENFTNNPENVFSDLAKWIGLSDVQSLINFGTTEHHNVSGNSSRFNSSAILPASKSWQTELSAKEIDLIRKKAGLLVNSIYGFKD